MPPLFLVDCFFVMLTQDEGFYGCLGSHSDVFLRILVPMLLGGFPTRTRLLVSITRSSMIFRRASGDSVYRRILKGLSGGDQG